MKTSFKILQAMGGVLFGFITGHIVIVGVVIGTFGFGGSWFSIPAVLGIASILPLSISYATWRRFSFFSIGIWLGLFILILYLSLFYLNQL